MEDSDKKLRILCINYEFPPLGGGAASVCHFLARELVALGHRVDLITMGFKGLKRFETIDGIDVYRVPCLRKEEAICRTYEMISFAVSAIPLAIRLARRNRYDINHTHFLFPSAFTSFVVKKVTGLPYVVTSHGSDIPGYNPDRFQLEHKLFQPIWRLLARNSTAIGSPSRSLKELILSQWSRTPIEVIPNGIDIAQYHPGNGEKKQRVLMVSRLLPRKGFQYVLEALSGIDGDVEAVIVGDGPMAEDLKQQAKDLGVNARFTGWIEKDSAELRKLYASSSIFALPSEMENFSIALVEAMASGMAVLTSNAGGCPEVVGDTALIVEPRDVADMRTQLGRLFQDQVLREDLGQRARQRVEDHFTWQAVARQYETLLQKYQSG